MDKFLLWLWVGAALAVVAAGLVAWWRPAATQKEDKDRLQTEYFRTALHYYILGRYATTAKLLPIPGNLVHHAIEFFLKVALIENLDEAAKKTNFVITYQNFGGAIKEKETIRPWTSSIKQLAT